MEWSFTLLASRIQSAKPVYALKLIRRMNYHSPSLLISADDGNLHVLKLSGCAKHPDALAHQMLWTEAARSVGLPVPPGGPIIIRPSFLEENPSLEVTAHEGCCAHPGHHYGSRFMGEVSGPGRPISYLLRQDVIRLSNRADFLGMYILDIVAVRRKDRKAIFLRDRGNGRYRAIFVGGGQMFDLLSGDFKEDKEPARHLDPSFYTGLWNDDAVASWVKTFEGAFPRALEATAPLVPDDWHSGNIDVICATSLRRLDELPRLLERTLWRAEAI